MAWVQYGSCAGTDPWAAAWCGCALEICSVGRAQPTIDAVLWWVNTLSYWEGTSHDFLPTQGFSYQLGFQ